MVFGIDPVATAKKEVLKLDANHNKVPDAIEALDAAQAVCGKVGSFIRLFDAGDIKEVLHLLPASVKAKLPEGAIEEAAVALADAPAAIESAKSALAALEAELEK